VDALRQAHVVVAPRTHHDQRWPSCVPAAVELGLRSQLAVRRYLDDQGTLGGLNLYSTTSDDVDPEAEGNAELFAAHAAIALGNARERENLNQALHIPSQSQSVQAIQRSIVTTIITAEANDSSSQPSAKSLRE
jgi:GAF domain-containing protein